VLVKKNGLVGKEGEGKEKIFFYIKSYGRGLRLLKNWKKNC